MDANRTATLRLIRIGLIAGAALLIMLYAIWRSFGYIRGPRIEIFQPINGSAVSSSTVTIIGRADRINSLSLDGETVFIDEAGDFKETLVLQPGLNIFTFVAKDQFGRTTQDQLQLVGTLK
jgi:Glucodextranase, domain B